jgi:hypothetical protein
VEAGDAANSSLYKKIMVIDMMRGSASGALLGGWSVIHNAGIAKGGTRGIKQGEN